MKRLLLLRHAKAVRESEGGDHARELNGRGRADSARMGAWLHVNKLEPDCVLSSSSARTIETWRLLSPELPNAPEPEFLDTLYLAPWKAIINVIRHKAADSADTLLVIGHNPGLEECALALAEKPDTAEARETLAEMREKFPTCTLAAFECDIDSWSDLAPGGNVLTAFVRPRDLKED